MGSHQPQTQGWGDSQRGPARHLWGLCVFLPRGYRLVTRVARRLPLTWLVHLSSLSSLRACKSLFMPCLLLPTSVCNFLATRRGWGGSILFTTARGAPARMRQRLKVPRHCFSGTRLTPSSDGHQASQAWATPGGNRETTSPSNPRSAKPPRVRSSRSLCTNGSGHRANHLISHLILTTTPWSSDFY